MKNFLIVCILILASLASTSALAQHRGYYGHHSHRYHSSVWVTPLIIGGVAGYAITRNREPIIVQQPVVVTSPQAMPICGPWVETQQPNGSIVRQRTCTE